MSTINIMLTIDNIDKTEIIQINIFGILMKINKQTYVITLHQNLPIKSIKINNIIINNDDVIKCRWNDLLIIPIILKETKNVFKYFVKKHLDNNDKLFINDIKVKYIQDIFFPISMLPDYPHIMYYIIKNISGINNIKLGMPIINDNNKLVGIISRIEDDILYCIPINYVFLTLNRKDNHIYTINEDFNNIKKINNNKIIGDKIYCIYHKTYVPIDCYININYDKINRIYLNNNVEKCIYSVLFDNNDHNEGIIIKDNKITLTIELLHLLKLSNYDNVLDIILTISKNKDFELIYNSKKYIISH